LYIQTLKEGYNFILSKEIITSFISSFWHDVMDGLDDNQYVILLLKVNMEKTVIENGILKTYDVYATFDVVNRVIKTDKIKFTEKMNAIYDIKLDNYKEDVIRRLIMEYWIKEKPLDLPIELLSTLRNIKKIKNPENELKSISSKYYTTGLPLNRDYKTWGDVLYNDNDLLIIRDKDNKDKTYHIEKGGYGKIKLGKQTLYTFEDHNRSTIKPKLDENIFVRIVNNHEFFILKPNKIGEQGELILKTIKYKTDFIKPTKKDKKLINKFITFDIETRVQDNEHIPYAICYYDGINKYYFYVTEFKDHNHMIYTVLSSLLKPKYSGYNVYVHNLSNFDGIFLLNNLANIMNEDVVIYPVLRDGNFINIKIKYGKNSKYNLSFRDSYLLLPLGLHKLSKQFNVTQAKTHFPYNFVNNFYNKNIDLDYIGEVPNFNYFVANKNVTDTMKIYMQYLEEYIENNNTNNKGILNNWSLKNETLRYCMNDCISLYQVLIKFNEYIFNKFKINVHKTPTLPSLTFTIFRSNFLSQLNKKGYFIPLILDKMYKDLKVSYTGGSTDMFIPQSNKNSKVYCYDVNSLYPTSMAKDMLMPVVSKNKNYVTYFEGDITKYLKKLSDFSIVESKLLKN
jgi:hypothetical protein